MCRHSFAKLLVKKGKKIFTLSNFKICLKCGELRVGKKTIRLSKDRLDMGFKPIRRVSEIDIRDRLKIPVGTDKYS